MVKTLVCLCLWGDDVRGRERMGWWWRVGEVVIFGRPEIEMVK